VTAPRRLRERTGTKLRDSGSSALRSMLRSLGYQFTAGGTGISPFLEEGQGRVDVEPRLTEVRLDVLHEGRCRDATALRHPLRRRRRRNRRHKRARE
jgi:hypothetical protein